LRVLYCCGVSYCEFRPYFVNVRKVLLSYQQFRLQPSHLLALARIDVDDKRENEDKAEKESFSSIRERLTIKKDVDVAFSGEDEDAHYQAV